MRRSRETRAAAAAAAHLWKPASSKSCQRKTIISLSARGAEGDRHTFEEVEEALKVEVVTGKVVVARVSAVARSDTSLLTEAAVVVARSQTRHSLVRGGSGGSYTETPGVTFGARGKNGGRGGLGRGNNQDSEPGESVRDGGQGGHPGNRRAYGGGKNPSYGASGGGGGGGGRGNGGKSGDVGGSFIDNINGASGGGGGGGYHAGEASPAAPPERGAVSPGGAGGGGAAILIYFLSSEEDNPPVNEG